MNLARQTSKAGALLMAFILLAAACSGASNGDSADDLDPVTAEDSPLNDEEANAPIEQIDTASGGVASGPITGLLTIQPSFGFGAYAVDSQTGQASAIGGIAAVETVDRNSDVIVSGNAAYALGFKTREGQTFANDFSVLKFDYETGDVRQLADLGFDKETDNSTESVSHRLQAVAGNSVVVSQGDFFGDTGTYTVYDAETGAETASFDTPRYEFESDSGTCSGGINNLVGLTDGRVAGTALNSPAFLDLETGEIELLIGCDQDAPNMADFVAVGDLNDYAVFQVGATPTDEDLERLLDIDLEPEHAFVEGDGDLWWIDVSSRIVNETDALVGGVVQFDLATQSVQAVHPLGVHLGSYGECEDDVCLIETIAQAQMRFIDGRLIIMDSAENGLLYTLDPVTSDLTTTTLDLQGVDFTTADLLGGDRNAVWLEVRRMTVVSDDENGRQSAGDSYIELVDAQTGAIKLSLAGEDLFR